jgi:hypothetical protein
MGAPVSRTKTLFPNRREAPKPVMWMALSRVEINFPDALAGELPCVILQALMWP